MKFPLVATAKKLNEVSWEQIEARGNGPPPRSGHSITVSGEKAIIFGGCGVNKTGAQGQQEVFNDTWILTTQEPHTWEQADVMGDVPVPRWRHTATLLPDGAVLVFGGLCRGKRFNDTFVLNVDKMEWSIKECAGTPPHPRSHHTANLVEMEPEDDLSLPISKVFIIGGYGGPGTSRDFFMDIHILELDTWSWIRVANVRGPPPKPRSDHCTCYSRGKLILSGGRGWSQGKAHHGFFDDIHVLNVKTMEWELPPENNPEDENPIVWPTLPSTLWNHMAMGIESVPSDKMFIFGGQKAPREYSNQICVMDLTTMQWDTRFTIAGTPPPPREDAGCAYDLTQCNLIFFGGWKQRWWDDILVLNVAGVVGPPYAVLDVVPSTGPLTGLTPITLKGQRFKESTMVSVRFTDGRKMETTVSGQYVSDTEITCKSPDFSKFGAIDVIVRVSIGGDPFTVNEVYYSYYANTKAVKCIAFGPGLISTRKVAGQMHSFMLQAKDFNGKRRTTGLDPVSLKLENKNGLEVSEDSIVIEDLMDGRYKISYAVPSAGDWTMTVSVDENAYAEEHVYHTAYGFPMQLSFFSPWASSLCAGQPAKVKSYTRFYSPEPDKNKVYIYVKDIPDTGVPDLPDDKALGLAPAEEGEEAAGEEEAAAAEDPAEAPAAEEPLPTGGEQGESEKPPEVWRAPDMVYILDVHVTPAKWSSALLYECDVQEPNFVMLRDAKLDAIQKLGVPGHLARAMMRPHTLLEDWSIPGVKGKCPTPRQNFLVEIIKEHLYVYGGMLDKDNWYDDVYQLNMKAKTWSRLYMNVIEPKVAAGRFHVFANFKLIALSKGVVGDALEVCNILDIEPMIDKKRDEFKSVMQAEIEKSLKALKDKINATAKDADKNVTGPEDDKTLKEVMNALKTMRVEGADMQFSIDQLQEMFSYFRDEFVVKGNDVKLGKIIDKWEKGLSEIDTTFSSLNKLVPTRTKEIKPIRDAVAAEVKGRLQRFQEELEKYRIALFKRPILKGDFKANQGFPGVYNVLNQIAIETKALGERMKTLNADAQLFEFGEKAEEVNALLTSTTNDLILIKNVWDLIWMVDSQVEAWRRILWNDINAQTLEEEAKTFQKLVRALPKETRDWDIYRSVDASVKNFLVSVPCVSDLKSPSMRDRHWKQLMEVTKVTVDVNNHAFSLADLLALNLQNYVDDVGEVVDRATKEDKMEQTLDKLRENWAVVEFGFEQHNGTEVYLIALAEESFEMLEENQLVVQGMMASKYLATFEELVTGWQKKLSNVSDVLAQMSDTQRKWAYLETLFIGSDEVKKELPEDAARFATVDVQFKELLKHFKETPNCVTSCSKDGLLKELEDIAATLELCEKALADFLEAKRTIFPRFYFVSQVMLLDILSNGNRPWVVLKNVNAIFQGIKEMGLDGDPAITVTTFVSNEGETVKIEETGTLSLTGKVENYLNDLIAKMRHELRAQLGKCIADYTTTGESGKNRPEWLKHHIAQLALVTTQQQWSVMTEKALRTLGSGGDPKALQTYYEFQLEMLADMIKMVQGNLPKLLRRSAMNIITLEAHSRDINAKMIRLGVDRTDHFEWLGQLKTNWEKHVGHGGQTQALDKGEEFDAVLYICDALFRYSFEYLGCAGRLVITPLTDRIYITATQSAHLILGCAPQGPAGTGKTETTKDLSAQLGKAVYVFNCGPEMDYRTMGDIFKGLASSGSWGCFDEFNRLMAEVLSVCTIQWKSVLDGIRSGGDHFRFNGLDCYLHPDGCMSFITMNPGYLGRQELPESLKVLFRPVTVMVPDFQLIMENMMMSEGYTTAAQLAKKFFTLYKLSGDLLGGNPSPPGKQLHYDWGLRAIGSVLKVAGAFLRAEKADLLAKGLENSTLEAGLLMRALRDFNLPKIVDDDLIVFMGLIKDLFSDVFELMPRMRDYKFEDLVKEVAVETVATRSPPKLQPTDYFVQNVVDLQDLLALRHCVFTIGLSGSNKSMCWQTLAKCWTRGGVMGKTTWKDINPKSITPNELYGYINMATREWKDGLLSSTMRDMANAPDSNPKWIILDGDLDANWIENMNSVMDDNRLLTLASNERIRLLVNMKMIFEIRDLVYASPATVTRAGVLFISDASQWKNYVQSWIEAWLEQQPIAVKPDVRKAWKAKAEELFEKYCGPVLLELTLNFKHVVHLLDFGLIQAITNFLQGLWVVDNIGTKDASALEIYFVFACVWGFGGAMSITSGVDYRKKFSQYWKDTWKTVKFPHRGEVFDVFVDKTKKDFVSWSDIVPDLEFDSVTSKMSLITVPTMETVAISFWLDNLLPNKHGAMLIGAAGCGKTAMINGKLRSLPSDFASQVININYYTNSNMFQKVLEAPLEKKAGKNFGPPGNKKLIYFVDDLNMAALDKYGTASNISLMRQHMGYNHIYDMNKLTEKVLLNTQYLAAMNPTAGSFVVNPRLQRLFATFAISFPSLEALNTIYSTFLLGHLSKFNEETQEVGKRLVQAALQLHKRVASTFRKTASNFHYEFNVRHVAGVFQGMLMGQPQQVTEPLKMVQLWLHESERTYGDRLVSVSDLKKYKELAVEQAKKFFKEMSPPTLFAEPLIFCHFAQGVGDKVYDRVTTFADLSTLLNGALDEYNETNAAMNLVLFEDAMRHVCRVSRIIESSGGHALMVGVGGMGKQSLARLATFVNGYSAFQVVITARYSVNDLKADLQTMYRKAGLKNEGISFIFTDQQIADERFLVFMNDLLSSGNIPGLFPGEDMDEIINGVRPLVKRAGLPDTRDNCWDMFINTVRDNLHVILCFSPIGDPIKIRTRRFPALVNCVVIDWFQPWPEEALTSVSKRFLDDVDLGEPEAKLAIMNFMPYSFLAVNKVSEAYEAQERRYNYTTPKSFLELIALYKAMLFERRAKIFSNIKKLSDGVLKLESTAAGVAELEEEIKVKAVEVEAKKAEVDAMIPKLEEEKGKAGDEAAKANVIAAAAEKKEAEVIAMKADIETKLAAAEPALIAASAALDSLNVKDLGELKSLKKPPAGVDDVTAACLCLLQTKDMPFKKVDTSWKAAQAMMSPPPKFLEQMLGFKQKIDDGLVPKSNFPNIQELLRLEHFDVEIQRKKSNAAAGLTDFIININVYNDINENVEPMRQAAASATAELEAAIAAKAAALAAKQQAEDTVAELTRQFNEATDEKEAVIAQAERFERKLGLAQRLMAALGSEGARWKESIVSLKDSLHILVGDVLLASAFVSYIGCFNKRFRAELMGKTFLPYLKGELPIAKGGVPMSDSTDPLKVLTTDAQIAGWNTELLPSDRVSTENGAIVTSCARWPLMIDPQLQGIRWIKKHEESRGLKVVRLGQKTLLGTLSQGIENGVPVIIENIQLVIDAVLNPVIGRQTIKRGRNLVVKLGDKEVDYHKSFRLYLQTKLSNPHYPPEIQAETTLVNFMVTEDGLEDQLLATVVQLERPDLAEQKDQLISQQNNFKIKLTELEDGILEQLATAEGDVTENIALIENLEDSKATSIEVAEKMIIAKQTEVVIEEAREQYRPVANRGALMFFLLSDLFKVHTFHFYSLSSFDLVYQRAIAGRQKPGQDWKEEVDFKQIIPPKRLAQVEAAEEAAAAANVKKEDEPPDPAILQERLKYLVENITYEVFNYARRGLFEKHKLIVATMLMLRILQRRNEAPVEQVQYLIMRTKVPNPPTMTAKVQEYLTGPQWGAVCALKEIEPFKGITEDLELNVEAWREWLELPNPEEQELPGDWQKKVTPFAKLLLVRALRSDRVTAALTSFITEVMGARYMVQEPFSLASTFEDTTAQTPVFFVLFPGVDPGDEIEALGKKLGFTEAKGNYVSISMGQGQEKNGESVLDRFTREGGWAFLQNVHLMQGWLPMLERKLEIAQEVGHPDFRCFVTAEPPGLPDQMLIPEGIMQAAIKVANEPPTDVKSLFRSALALFSQETFDNSSKPVQFKPMLFALSFFHSLCLGRRKFGMQGFSRAYAWNNGDLTVCGAILHNYLEANQDTPWADVRYLFGEVMYGGHITDPWDRRITSTYLEVLLNPELIDEKTDYVLAPGLRPLLEGEYKDYRTYIEEASPPETPALFGLHPNAEISLLNSLADGLFFSILSVGGGGGGAGGGLSKEDMVSEVQVHILEKLREDFVMLEIRMRIKEKGSPFVVFVLQELERMNKILSAMRTQLNELALGLSGALNISDSMDALINSIFMNQVPPNWLKACGQIGPTGTYNRKNLSAWYVDLQYRWQQLEEWSAPTKAIEQLPPSVWISGCFNPMGFVTASMQVTARANSLSLDMMRVHCEVTDVYDVSTVESQPEDGVYIHGLFMENARWDPEAPGMLDDLEVAQGVTTVTPGSIVDSKPKELYPVMPMIHIISRTVENAVPEDQKIKGRYICPFYTTTVRGPTYVFAGPLRSNVNPNKWILAGAALVMQPD